MSSTHLREHINKAISKLSILFFTISVFIFNANVAYATTLGSCGEIAVSGTYTLSSNLGTVGENCLNITTSGVILDGNNQYRIVGNITGDSSYYSLTNMPIPDLLSILGDFYFNNAAADGNWGNKSNWTTAALPVSSDNVFITGNVSSYAGNKALALNGSGFASRASAVSLGTVFSLDFWMKSSAMPNQILLTEAAGFCSPIAFSPNNNPTQISANIGCGANNWTIWYNVAVADNQWHHWVLTRNVRNLKLYRDGVLIGTATPITSSTTSYTHLGSGAGGAQKLTGSLDQFVYWSKELSQAEVTSRFNLGAGAELTDYTSVIAEYRFDNNYNDSSPNARHLAAGGSGNSFVVGALSPSSNPYPQVQVLDVQSGTVSTAVQTTAGAKIRGTANITGNIIGTADFYGDLSNLNGSISDINNINLVTKGYQFASDRTNYVSIPHSSSIDLSPPFSVGFWVKTNETSRTNLFSKMNKASWRGWYVHLLSNKIIAAINQDGGNQRYLFSAANINDGQWKHVVVNFGSYNVSDIDVYVNGVEGTVSEASSGTVTTILNTSAALISNSSTANQTEYFDGQLTGSFIYNRTLTQQEVSSMYQSGTMVTGTAQKLYLKMNGNFTDSSQYGNNGTGFNSPVSVFAKLPITYPDNATIRRIYESDATTTRDFTLNSGRWIIESDGADINLSGATYAVSTTTYQTNKNVFRAKNGATFTENPSINGGAHVVPKVVINSPISGTITNWNPNINWDDADTCQYKWGAGGTYANVNCASGGSDIPKPTGMVSTALYVKGIYNDTSYSEQISPSFVYDNVSPAPADCSIPMDEPDREYYYLENDIAGDCTATANVILKGNVNPGLPGYTINGQFIANATSTTNGFNLTLENITITGTTTANGSGAGNAGGDISVSSSTLSHIVTNGGDVSLADSSADNITTSSNTTGVSAGDVTLNNSTVEIISANSQDSGLTGGVVTITDSTTENITTNGGAISVQNSNTSQLASNSNSGGILGGNITVDVSTTTAIYANGGDITISTSTVGLLDSTSPTAGIAGGDIEVTSSSAESVTTNGGSVSIIDSTISNINADGISGIANVGAITVTNSTLTDISANGTGSGSRGGHVTVTNSNPTSITTNGGNISLTNVTTGAINADGNTGLSTAATIDITNSTTTDITANGGTGGSGVGGNGAAITITNSTVGLVDTNGGSSGKRGGAVTITDSTTSNITTNGGAISVQNSNTSQLASNSNSGGILGGNITVDVSTTTAIYANGGDITVSTSTVGLLDSTSPTDGVAGGDITITNPISTIPSITTNGGDVTLNNVVVIGAITANGNTGGVSAGAITIEFSTTTAIYANGGAHSSGDGGNGATITIATSTTGLIEASGADSTGNGGDGGVITITNSIGTSASSTPITANGGDSTSCGNGGDSGIITIINTTYGTITAEPGIGFNGGCPSDAKISGIKNTVTTVGEGHPSTIRPPSPTPPPVTPGAVGGGINPLFKKGLNNIDLTPIQQFNLFGDGSAGGFKPIDAGTTRLPRVFTDLNRLNDFLLDDMPVDILPSLELFVFDTITEDLANLFPNSSNLLAAVGVDRSQELAGLFRSPRLVSDIENPEKYGLFKVYSGDIVVNTYVAYEQAIENLAQLIKANPSQIIHIGSYAKGKITDESKVPYIIYQGQKKLMTPTFDGYYATSIIAPNLEGRYLIETSSSVQILLDVLPQNQSNEQSKPWGIFHKLWKLFH